VIPIDYPGFNLWVARAGKAAGVPVLYYIAPQLWAWRPGRAKRFAAAVDRMAVILPFEEQFFNQVGVRAAFVGHPLLDGEAWPTQLEARAALSISQEERVLALFPGSRDGEITQHWPIFRDAAVRLLDRGRCHRVVVGGMEEGAYPDPGPVEIIRGRPVHVLAAADAAVAKSGTTTLQAAVADTPMVVAYRTNAVNAFLFRRLITVEWTSLVNLIADREVVPELLQEDLTEDRLVDELHPLLDMSSRDCAWSANAWVVLVPPNGWSIWPKNWCPHGTERLSKNPQGSGPSGGHHVGLHLEIGYRQWRALGGESFIGYPNGVPVLA